MDRRKRIQHGPGGDSRRASFRGRRKQQIMTKRDGKLEYSLDVIETHDGRTWLVFTDHTADRADEHWVAWEDLTGHHRAYRRYRAYLARRARRSRGTIWRASRPLLENRFHFEICS